MIREKSCGAVIFFPVGTERLYLVEQMRKGHYSICKGHVEGAETEHETAAREIGEETALQVRFLDGFRETEEYSPYDGCMKEVVFFLAQADSTLARPQPEEVREIFWLPLELALRQLTFESDREILRRADAFLQAAGAGCEAGPDKLRCRIVDGADKMKTEDIIRLLRTSYWANKRSAEQIEKSVRNSSCYGVCLEGEDRLVGFARVISDYSTTYYLCDVIVDEAYRHKGLGTALVSYIDALPEYAGLRGLLITRDAHGLYRKFGYEVMNDRVMVK